MPERGQRRGRERHAERRTHGPDGSDAYGVDACDAGESGGPVPW